MNVTIVHNHYQHPGGEDQVVRAEAGLLRAGGHHVAEYTRSNDVIVQAGAVARARLAVNTVWARGEADALRRHLEQSGADVAHFHNTLPLISPAAYYACRQAGVPVVQTLHNYRLICPSANLFRNGRICEDCREKGLLSAVRHACYRGSRGATTAVAAMLAVHRAIGTWRDQVDVYIALSEFARRKFVAAGLPAHKVIVKPNFIDPDPGAREGTGDYAIFAGRFWPEKGLQTLLAAWSRSLQHVPLEIVGDGPDRAELEAAASRMPHVRFRGHLPREQTLEAIKRARFLIFPSEWYEGLPMTLIEAFACGVPVITSRLGSMEEVVHDRRTGLHFTAGDAADLAAAVAWAWSHPAEMDAMGRAARAEFEARYTAARNQDQLIAIYERAIDEAQRRVARGRAATVTSPGTADSYEGASR